MSRVLVQYMLKPETAAENEKLIRCCIRPARKDAGMRAAQEPNQTEDSSLAAAAQAGDPGHRDRVHARPPRKLCGRGRAVLRFDASPVPAEPCPPASTPRLTSQGASWSRRQLTTGSDPRRARGTLRTREAVAVGEGKPADGTGRTHQPVHPCHDHASAFGRKDIRCLPKLKFAPSVSISPTRTSRNRAETVHRTPGWHCHDRTLARASRTARSLSPAAR
jgi:hypothetical protein